MTLHEQVITTLEETLCRGRKLTLGHEESLMEGGFLDSLAFLELREVLQRRFGVTVEADEFTPENLDSIGAIARFLESKQNTH
jgi:acyl carrier protein